MEIPKIVPMGGIPTLYVKGEPFLAFAGEVHNSSGNSLEYMERQVWPNVEGLNLNTLIVPVYWELVEPREGEFDFSLPDGIIAQARERGMHLIFLWFGLWKNSESMYVPGWMKLDQKTYFHVRKVNGETIDTISPFCEAAVNKDARAFGEWMAHLRKVDEEASTVIMVQVENEIGLLGTERDYSLLANRAFDGEVCDELKQEFAVSGNWKEAFGADAEEYFMAYHFARAVERIAGAGRERYPLPCYVNTWLKQYPWYPGSYPSGGPVKEVHRIWKRVAPSLCTLAPDIYLPYAPDVMDEYHDEGNPLLIPEARKDGVTASYALYAFMQHHALCYSPFGVEDLGLPPEAVVKPPQEVMAALNINPIMFETDGGKRYLSEIYDLLEQMKPLYFRYRGTRQMKSYIRHADTDRGVYLNLTKYDVLVDFYPSAPGTPVSAGVIFELEPDRFLICGMMSNLTFRMKPGEKGMVRGLRLEDGTVRNGRWIPNHIQNGDEQMQFRLGPDPTCLMAELYKLF